MTGVNQDILSKIRNLHWPAGSVILVFEFSWRTSGFDSAPKITATMGGMPYGSFDLDASGISAFAGEPTPIGEILTKPMIARAQYWSYDNYNKDTVTQWTAVTTIIDDAIWIYRMVNEQGAYNEVVVDHASQAVIAASAKSDIGKPFINAAGQPQGTIRSVQYQATYIYSYHTETTLNTSHAVESASVMFFNGGLLKKSLPPNSSTINLELLIGLESLNVDDANGGAWFLDVSMYPTAHTNYTVDEENERASGWNDDDQPNPPIGLYSVFRNVEGILKPVRITLDIDLKQKSMIGTDEDVG